MIDSMADMTVAHCGEPFHYKGSTDENVFFSYSFLASASSTGKRS